MRSGRCATRRHLPPFRHRRSDAWQLTAPLSGRMGVRAGVRRRADRRSTLASARAKRDRILSATWAKRTVANPALYRLTRWPSVSRSGSLSRGWRDSGSAGRTANGPSEAQVSRLSRLQGRRWRVGIRRRRMPGRWPAVSRQPSCDPIRKACQRSRQHSVRQRRVPEYRHRIQARSPARGCAATTRSRTRTSNSARFRLPPTHPAPS